MNIDYTVPTNFSSWWKRISLNDWRVSSSVDIFEEHDHKGQVYIYKQNNNINSSKIKQYFRDGINHCMLNPIRLWAEEKVNNANSNTVTKRYNTILKRISNFETIYDKGVPEDAVSEICNSLQIDITIELPFSINKFINSKRKLNYYIYL